MIVIKTVFGRQVEIIETDQFHNTELKAMKEAKKWGEGWRKLWPVNYWHTEPPDPWSDEPIVEIPI